MKGLQRFESIRPDQPRRSRIDVLARLVSGATRADLRNMIVPSGHASKRAPPIRRYLTRATPRTHELGFSSWRGVIAIMLSMEHTLILNACCRNSSSGAARSWPLAPRMFGQGTSEPLISWCGRGAGLRIGWLQDVLARSGNYSFRVPPVPHSLLAEDCGIVNEPETKRRMRAA